MIAVDHVTKTYGTFTAVDDVSFNAFPGRITGFLGPNGAGKSTTLRVLVGLTPPDRGAAQVLGRRFKDLPNPGMEVGVLLDASAQHAGRTGREVLTVARRTMGLPAARVEEVLHTVGLSEDEAARRLRDYSLGMRQRLGLAHALLGDPEVLVLDEPANGLDPAGIRWMRDLLRGYADRGATVLLSSHLLHEIEVVADDLVVIGQGRVAAAGTKADLLAGAGTHVATRHSGALSAALASANVSHQLVDPTVATAEDQPTVLRVDTEPETVGQVAATAGVALTELRSADGAGLEEMFLALTADTQRDQHPATHTTSPLGAVA
jgi:ABC-2 type transport system ATP-binding protein